MMQKKATDLWSDIYQFGIDVFASGNSVRQCEYIKSELGKRFSCIADVYLTKPLYPIPNEPNVPLVLDAAVKRHLDAILRKKETSGIGTSTLAVPINNQTQIMGVILLNRGEEGIFTEDEANHVEALAAMAGINMETYRQLALREWRSNQMGLVETVSAHVVTTPDLRALCEQVAQSIQESFGFYFVSLFTIDEKTREIIFQAGYGEKVDHFTAFAVPKGEGIIGTVAEAGVAIITPDVSRESRFRFIPELPDTKAEITLPLRVEGYTVGVMDIQLDKPQAIHQFDLGVLQALADHIAVAIDSSQTFISLQNRTDQLSAVLEISQTISSNLDLNSLLDEVSRLIKDHFGYDFIHVYVLHQGRKKLHFQGGSSSKTEKLRNLQVEFDLNDPHGIIPWVARNNKHYLAPDIATDPKYLKPSAYYEKMGSELAIPLVAGGSVLGVLDLQTKSKNGFNVSDIPLLQVLAGSIAIAIRNASLFQSELWRRKVADSFKQIAGLVSSNTAIPTLMGKILGSLNKILPCRAAAIVVVNDTVSPDADDRFKVVKCFGVNKSKLDQLINDRTDLRVTLEFVLNSDKPLIRRPTTPRGPLGEALGYPIEYSSIAAPMKAGNDPLGVLLLAHPEPGRYGTEAGLIASTFANNAAVAIQNIDLYRSAQEQAWIANVLFKISELADSSESEFDFQCRLSRLFPLLVGLEACYLFDFDNEGKTYSFRAGYAKDEKSIRFSKRIRGEHLIDAPILLNKSLAKRYGLESLINLRNQDYYLFPMQSSTRTIGLILLSRKRSRADSVQGSDETIGTLQRWVNQIAISMENLHLNDAEEDQAYISNALLYFAGLAFRPGKPESSFPQLQAGFKLLLGLDDAMVIDDTNKSPSLVKIEGIAETMFMTVQSIEAFINQSRLKSDITALYSPQNNKSLILSPMVTGNESYGYILLQGTKFEQEMEEKRLELIRSVSHQFAAALQNQALIDESEELNRIDQEIQLARNIQTSYLPDSIPHVAGWNISASWEPARQVGGDFYDVFKLGDQKIAIVIADVSGKGIPAALNMTVARTLIRSFASPDRSPGRVLELVNNALIREDDSGSFTTAVYGILDVEHGIFHYSNAGHPHPKHVCQARSCIATMEASGMALGVMAENNYEDVAVYLESGDSLLLFTDGVSDTQSEAGNSFGDLRIDQALRDVANSGENLINRVTTKLKRFRRNASPFDDVTMVEIKRD